MRADPDTSDELFTEARPTLSERHRIDVENQARWTAGALARPKWGTVTVGLLPSDGTNYEVVLSERIAPDGRRTDGIIVSVLRAGSAAYVWHPGGYVDPIYVAQSWRLIPHTATVLAHFLTVLGERLSADNLTATDPRFVDARKFAVMEEMRDAERAGRERAEAEARQLREAIGDPEELRARAERVHNGAGLYSYLMRLAAAVAEGAEDRGQTHTQNKENEHG